MADSAHRCSSSDGPGHSEFETKRQLLSLDLGVVLPPGGGCLASSLVGALVSFVDCLRLTSRWRVLSQPSDGGS
jgi:hypothetical protein